jgi:N-acetylglucosaminyldiphosphoundecaprenol N-acetyl-beta-D-mannosaminyltransferase
MTDATTAESVCERPPIAILGVAFDNISIQEAIRTIDRMIASGRPHYAVTANVDFLVQAVGDVELRRILFDAHLALCDGTPVLWASRLLGNPLRERVAGADLTPLLIAEAARKGHRLFFLGATPESVNRAVRRLRDQYPGVIIAGHYSPPFNRLLEMDHDEIKRRILEAKPDLLLVSLGCPKQEKWIAMHYRSLGVPVSIGVGATIDFLAGQVKRAPAWMRRSGTEWLFRLAQEPRRLYRRYAKDLWVFGRAILVQWWQLGAGGGDRSPARLRPNRSGTTAPPLQGEALNGEFQVLQLPGRWDTAAVTSDPGWVDRLVAAGRHCLIEMEAVHFIDSTGLGVLIALQKRLREYGLSLILVKPSAAVQRALEWMGIEDFLNRAPDQAAARAQIEARRRARRDGAPRTTGATRQHTVVEGEITAANAEAAWEQIHSHLNSSGAAAVREIDLSAVSFIDSTGLGLLVKARKAARADGRDLRFSGARPAVLNVVRLARLEDFLFGEKAPRSRQFIWNPARRKAPAAKTVEAGAK